MRTLVLGLGNPYLRDDAVGIRLARDFRRRWEARGAADPAAVTVVEDVAAGGLALVECMAGYDQVVILDSIRTGAAPPGDWLAFTAEDLRETMNLGGIHDANFATALELGRRTGLALPTDQSILVFAVEIEENLVFDDQMSEILESRYPAISREILSQVESVLAARDHSPSPPAGVPSSSGCGSASFVPGLSPPSGGPASSWGFPSGSASSGDSRRHSSGV